MNKRTIDIMDNSNENEKGNKKVKTAHDHIEKPVSNRLCGIGEQCDQRLLKTELFIEGSYRQACLEMEDLQNDRKKFLFKSHDMVIKFDQSGCFCPVGFVGCANCQKWPVYVEFSFALVNGHRVTFYNPTSPMVDWNLIEEWLKTHFPNVCYTDNYWDVLQFKSKI